MSEYHVHGRIKAEFWTRERVHIIEHLNDESVSRVSLADARVGPGITTELHRLSVDEWYVIRSGAGLMEVDGGKPFEVAAGDSVTVPAGMSQRITNTGSDDLLIQCICMPRFTPDCYEALE